MYGPICEESRNWPKYNFHPGHGSDASSAEQVCLSVITFGGEAKQVVAQTEAAMFKPPDLVFEERGRCLGAALELLNECIECEAREKTSPTATSFPHYGFIFTCGIPNDDWEAYADKLKSNLHRIIEP
jgi:uncharacterized protein YegL